MHVEMIKLPNGVKRIVLEGRLDMQGANEIDMRFTAYTATEKAPVVVDLAAVPFLASIGIRLLLLNAKALQARGGKMALLNPAPLVEDVLKTTGLSNMIPTFTDLDGACAAVLGGM